MAYTAIYHWPSVATSLKSSSMMSLDHAFTCVGIVSSKWWMLLHVFGELPVSACHLCAPLTDSLQITLGEMGTLQTALVESGHLTVCLTGAVCVGAEAVQALGRLQDWRWRRGRG